MPEVDDWSQMEQTEYTGNLIEDGAQEYKTVRYWIGRVFANARDLSVYSQVMRGTFVYKGLWVGAARG